MSDQATDEEEKKGAGAPAWMSGGSAQVGVGTSSGASSAAGGPLMRLLAALAGPKAIVAATVLGGLALGLGVVNSIPKPQAPSVANTFDAARLRTGAPSGTLPGMEQPGQSALNMAQQANSGFYASAPVPAAATQRDQSTPDASVDAPADASAPGAKDAGQGGATDPSALTAGLLGKESSKARLAGGKFGSLSSGFGDSGGRLQLAGGAGLSGGIGGQFRQMKFSGSQEGRLQGMAGPRRVNTTRAMRAAGGLGGSAFKGATARRLDQMNRAMGNAQTGTATSAAAVHSQQWDGIAPAGGAITGAGASGISDGGQFSPNEGVGNGGPLSQPTSNGPTSAQNPPSTGPGTNQTPYQGQLDMAKGMLLLASALIVVIGALALLRNSLGSTGFLAELAALVHTYQTILLGIALGLATAAAAIAMSIGSQYGQAQQAQIVTLGGGITAAAAGAAMLWPGTTTAWLLVLAGIGGIAASIMGPGGSASNRSDITPNG